MLPAWIKSKTKLSTVCCDFVVYAPTRLIFGRQCDAKVRTPSTRLIFDRRCALTGKRPSSTPSVKIMAVTEKINFHIKKCKDVVQRCSFVTVVFKFNLKFKLPRPEDSRNIENGNREIKQFNNSSNWKWGTEIWKGATKILISGIILHEGTLQLNQHTFGRKLTKLRTFGHCMFSVAVQSHCGARGLLTATPSVRN